MEPDQNTALVFQAVVMTAGALGLGRPQYCPFTDSES